MKETGLLFTADNVRRLNLNEKTQTRRLQGLERVNAPPDDWELQGSKGTVWYFRNKVTGEIVKIRCPYGKAGGRIWGRETWALVGDYAIDPRLIYRVDGMQLLISPDVLWDDKYHRFKRGVFFKHPDRWRSAMFMPKWASRIWRDIGNVYPERLQDITEEDAKQEGTEPKCVGIVNSGVSYQDTTIATHRKAFSVMWDSINAKRGYPWVRNPWNWRLEFKNN